MLGDHFESFDAWDVSGERPVMRGETVDTEAVEDGCELLRGCLVTVGEPISYAIS
jgi:hypothetical protein